MKDPVMEDAGGPPGPPARQDGRDARRSTDALAEGFSLLRCPKIDVPGPRSTLPPGATAHCPLAYASSPRRGRPPKSASSRRVDTPSLSKAARR